MINCSSFFHCLLSDGLSYLRHFRFFYLSKRLNNLHHSCLPAQKSNPDASLPPTSRSQSQHSNASGYCRFTYATLAPDRGNVALSQNCMYCGQYQGAKNVVDLGWCQSASLI